MYLKNSLTIVMGKFSVLAKYATILFAIILFIAIIMWGAVAPGLKDFNVEIAKEITQQKGLPGFFDEFMKSASTKKYLITKYHKIAEIFHAHRKALLESLYVIVPLGILMYLVLNTIKYTLSDLYMYYMRYGAESKFTFMYFKNLKKSLAFACLKLVFSIILAAAQIALTVLLLYLFYGMEWKHSGTLAMAIVGAFSLFIISLRKTIYAMWLPTLVDEELGIGSCRSIKISATLLRENFAPILGKQFVFILFASMFYLVFSIATFGIGLLLGIALLEMFGSVLDLVIYHEKQNKKYYVIPNVES